MKRAWLFFGWILAGLTLIGPAFAQEPRRGGILRVAITAEPNTTDCHAGQSFAVIHHLAPHYSTLLRYDAARYPEVVGDVAESWTVSADGLTWTFRLRAGVRFHDGTVLTSRDVAASYARMRDPPQGVTSIRQEAFRGIDRIETPDPQVVVFRLSVADPAMLAVFASPWNCIYSAARLDADPRYPEREVMGTGPFRFVERVPGSHWVGARFAGYFVAGQPYLDGFRLNLMGTTAMLNALQGRQVDVEFRGETPPERDRLRQALGDQIVFQESPWLTSLTLSFNTERAPFSDPRVRRALSLAIDRWTGAAALARITALRFPGAVLRPGYALAPSDDELATMPGFGRDAQRNREEARRLLGEAGVPNLSFRLINRNIDQPYTAIALFLIDQWRQIGVRVEQVPTETGPYFASLASGNFDVIVDSTSDFVDEPTLNLIKYVSRDRTPINYSRYVDRELDSLFDRQRLEADPARRRELLRSFERRLLEQAYVAPLFWFQRIVGHSRKMHGFVLTPSLTLNQSMATIWLDE